MFNESTLEYYRNNLALTDYDTRHNLFRTDRNIYTRSGPGAHHLVRMPKLATAL